MELGKEFENVNFERERIVYPAYQTTHRFENLYSDVRTWVRELIQNADDANAKMIQFEVKMPKGIEVSNDGTPFDSNDIKRLLTPCLGGKDFEKTGAMNLGALSVLSISDTPIYHSGNTILKFVMNHEEEDFYPYINRHHEEFFNGTRLYLPFHPRLSSDDIKKLDKLNEYLRKFPYLLFASNLNEIKLIYPKKEYHVKKVIEASERIKDKRAEVEVLKIKIIENIKKRFKSKENHGEWLVFKRIILVPEKYARHGSQIIENAKLPVYLAFSLENDYPNRLDYPIFIIFPSETPFGLGFVLSSNFIPETSRKGFSTEGMAGKFNSFLLRKASEMLEIALFYFKDKITRKVEENKSEYFNALLKTLYYDAPYSPFESYIKEFIYTKIKKFLHANLLDINGNWIKASDGAVVEEELRPFFVPAIKILNPPPNEHLKKLLARLGVKELTISDLIQQIASGNKVIDLEQIHAAWIYFSNHSKSLNGKDLAKLLHAESLPNEMGQKAIPGNLYLPKTETIGLYPPERVVHHLFIENKKVRIYLQELGLKELDDDEILNYFISNKSKFTKKDLDLIIPYYAFFYNRGLYDFNHPIIYTNRGFKNPEEVFFNEVEVPKPLVQEIVFLPEAFEKNKNCRKYLEILGVSKKFTPSHVLSLIKKKGAEIVDLDVLKFLSENSHELSKSDLEELKVLDLIPSLNGNKVKARDCYFLTEYNQKIFANSVAYFDVNAEGNEIGMEFYEKLGINKEPRIKHLKNAVEQALMEYLRSVKKNETQQIKHVLKRLELIFDAIHQNKEREDKNSLINLLKEKKCIPSTKGIEYPHQVYLKSKEIQELLGESMPLSLIKLPTDLADKLQLRKKPAPEDVARYLLDEVVKRKLENAQSTEKAEHVRILDTIYSFLGQSNNFNELSLRAKKRLALEKIIYVPEINHFERANHLIARSKEAKVIFGESKKLLKLSHYPNSITFFKKIGLKTALTTDDLADFLVEYCAQKDIETTRLFLLYNTLGNRYPFLSDKKKQLLAKSKIVITEDLKSFEYPQAIYIPDEKSYLAKFSALKIATVNNKVLEFLEALGVKKVSEIIKKKIIFKGIIKKSDYIRILESKLKELIPYMEVIINETSLQYKNDWKNELKHIQYITCEEIYHELSYKSEKSLISGNSVEYDPESKTIGIINGIQQKAPLQFLNDLSRAISSVLFQGNISQSKLMSPLIEKLLGSENKIDTLTNLGFSTYKLEIKKLNAPDLQLIIRDRETPNRGLIQNSIKEENVDLFENLPRISSKREKPSLTWKPTSYEFYKKEDGSGVHVLPANSEKNSKPYSKNKLKIIIEDPPSKNELIQEINSQIADSFHIDKGKLVNYYKIDRNLKKDLKKNKKILFKTMEFPANAEFGGLEINPPIPELTLQQEGNFFYYGQEPVKSIEIGSLKKFKMILEFIIDVMDGNSDTVSVALFNTPVHAFNFRGQLIFNYSMMVDESLEREFPLPILWIMIAAHELAHNITKKHDQLHSKYLMIFTIKALKNLNRIIQKYKETYS